MPPMDDPLRHEAETALSVLGVTGLDAASFAKELGRRFGKDATALRGLNVADLALAWAALEGDSAALRELDRRLRACGARFDDEVLQSARDQLLIGAKPKLRSYGGKGALTRWLRTVLATIAVDVRRRGKADRQTSDEDLAVKASGEAGADVRLMSARQRDEFTRAFAAAIAALDPKERMLLRMRYVDDVSLEVSARALGTHRTTAARWLESAMQKVLQGTRERLAERLRLAPRELDSLWRALEPSLAERLSKLLPAQR